MNEHRKSAAADGESSSGCCVGSMKPALFVYALISSMVALAIAVAYIEFLAPILYFRLDFGWVMVTALVTILGMFALLTELIESVEFSGVDHPTPVALRRVGLPCLSAAVIIGLGSCAIFGFYEGIFLALLSAAQVGILAILFVLLLNTWTYLSRSRQIGR